MESLNEPLIIAEAGINHKGIFNNAIKLIDAAKNSGADFVKFHAAYSSRISNKNKYNKLWKENHPDSEPFSDFVRKVEFTKNQFGDLRDYSKEIGIELMVTPYDTEALKMLFDLNIRNIKFASCDIIKLDMISHANKKSDLLVLATGMADEKEIEKAVSLVDKDKTYVLHCISLYPMPLSYANLNYINHLYDKYNIKVGYSDHTDDIVLPVLSLAFGAKMIEKHFMLSIDQNVPDRAVSVTEGKLKDLVNYSKNFTEIIGKAQRVLSSDELFNRNKFRNRWVD